MIRRLLAAAALLVAVLFAVPALAGDPTPTSLPFTQGGVTYNEWTWSDGTRFYPGGLHFGWNYTTNLPKAWSLDSNGYGGVNVQASALPAGAATSALQTSIVNTVAAVQSAIGTSAATAATVQGAAGGVPVPVSGAVVAGNQSYATGSTQQLNLTTTGRLKVGLSMATNIAPGALPGTTLESDLVGCTYRAAPPTWSDGWSGALACNAAGNLLLDLGAVSLAPLTASAAYNAPFGGEGSAITVGGGAVAAGRSLKANCTVAGTVVVTYADGSTGAWMAQVGTNVWPAAATGVASAAATCTYANLK